MKALAATVVPALSMSARAGSDYQSVLSALDQDEHPDLRGVVVLSGDEIAAERYYNGDTADSVCDVRSVAKSVTSLLIGIAIDKGLIHSVKDPVQRYWPEARGSAIGEVTLHDLLTMRTGLAADDQLTESAGNESRLSAAADPMKFVLSVPRANPAGSTYSYNSLAAYTAGLIIEKVARKTELEFARDTLFQPLKIARADWASDTLGHTTGQGNLSISTRTMAVIGQVVLAEGKFGHHRIVSKDWIRASVMPWVPINGVDPYADAYGYHWFLTTLMVKDTPAVVSYASGNGGNKIYVIPSSGLVVAISSSAYGHGYAHHRSLMVLKAVLEV